MLLGIRFKANPTVVQKRTLGQWMGCARFIWNAKCESISFCYADSVDDAALITDQGHLSYLREATPNDLNQYVVGIDRGVTIPLQAGDESFDFTPGQKKKRITATASILEVVCFLEAYALAVSSSL